MKKNKMWFLAPDEGGAGGGEQSRGVAAAAPDESGSSDESGSADGKVTDVDPKVPAPATTVDAGELAEKFGAVLAERFKPTETPAKTVDALTPEEAEKVLNVWKPTKEWIAKFGNLDTQEDALKELRDGFIRHGDTISQYRMNELKKAIEAKYEPVLTFMQQYQNEQATNRFNARYGQLSDPALIPVVEAITEKLSKSGKKFDDEDALFTAIATEAEKAIRVINPEFKLTAGSSPATTKAKGQSNNSIPVTTPGSGGGGGGKGNDGPPVKRGIAIFQNA